MKEHNNALHLFFARSIVLVLITFVLLLVIETGESMVDDYESYRGVLAKECTFSYSVQTENRSITDCYVNIDRYIGTVKDDPLIITKKGVTIDQVSPSVSMETLNASKIWKSKVSSSSILQQKYDNVAEPSFASNGSLVFYTGNHFAAKSSDGINWTYINPSFDFKSVEKRQSNDGSRHRTFTPIFKADQHVEYDPLREMYLWVRQSEQVRLGGSVSNIDRLAISKDLDLWVVYDLKAIDILNQAGLIKPIFDYPDTVLTDKYLYMTTSVYENNSKYGMAFRFSLDELSSSIDKRVEDGTVINYEVVLDRDVETIIPVQGASDPMYFASHLPHNNSIMKIYTWFDGLPSLNSTELEITRWNDIKNRATCTNPEAWWCKANTSSRMTSAWMSDNTINFLWNAIASYDGGNSWLPYIDSATFYLNESLRYERRYHLADPSMFWIFEAVSPDKRGNLGIGAFYVDTNVSNSISHPYMNYAFGVFNHTESKWKMMPVLNSTAPLPVVNEEGNEDHNFGDFLTTKAHRGIDGVYSWDAGGYIIIGPTYRDIEAYYIMIKN